MKTFSFIIYLFITNSIFANTLIAEAIKVRGEVTQLAPGAKAAKAIATGDKFLEDTSILTGPKSFIKIKFIDNSEMNIGPDSKIVVSEMKKGEPGIISLLKGKIRTEVQKNSNSNVNKFFIKTRTAAMGVRGTDFQTIYNPENKVTSLLTYKGEVAMAKIDDHQYRKLEESEDKGDQKIEVKRDEVTHDVEVSKIKNDEPQTNSQLKNELNKILNSKGVVSVPPGQNSMASDNLIKATLPIKISPAQLNVLYKNSEFKEKEEANNKALDEKTLKEVKLDIKSAPQVAPLEGIYNPTTGDFAPKSGGFIDMQTGLYVSPDNDARLDKNLGVFVSSRVGSIEKDTGAYLAPSGLKLDAKKGFIVDGTTDDPKLLAMKDDLNGTIAKDVMVKNPVITEVVFNPSEKYIRDEVLYTLANNHQKLELNKNQANSYSLDANKDNLKLALEWRISIARRIRPLIGGEFINVNYRQTMPTNFSEESRKLFSLYAGGMYAYNENFDFFMRLGEYQNHYVNQIKSTNNYKLQRVVATKFSLGVHSQFFVDWRSPLEIDFWGDYQMRKRLNTIKIKEGGGIGIAIGTNYKLSSRDSIYMGVYGFNQNLKVSGEVSENTHERSDNGLKLTYILKI